MKPINISDKGLIILVGPTASGKSTFANRLKAAAPHDTVIISGDKILEKIDKTQTDAQIDEEFKLKFMEELKSIHNPKDKFIVFDMIHTIRDITLQFMMWLIWCIVKFETITIIKFDLPLELQIEYSKKRELSRGIKTHLSIILGQRDVFYGPDGSLNANYQFSREFVITNPEEIDINIDD